MSQATNSNIKISYDDLKKLKEWMDIDESLAKKYLTEAKGNVKDALKLAVNEK